MVGPDGTRELISMTAIDLRRNGADNGVCDRIAAFAIGNTGLRPQALTSDDGWNTLSEDWWNYEYSPACDARGRINMHQMQWQAVSLRPTMGGVYWQLMADGTVRPVETERVRQPSSKEAKEGCVDGVKVDNKTGRILGYYVHSRDANGQFPLGKDGVYVKAELIIPVIRPPWRPDQVREIADFAAIITNKETTTVSENSTLSSSSLCIRSLGKN
jgi:capsid protein